VSGDGIFIARARRGKLLLFLILTLGFVTGGIWMTGDTGVSDSRRGMGLDRSTWGWLSIVFFGTCATIFAAMLVQRTPPITESPEGVTVKWMFGPAYGPIRWDEISRVETGVNKNLRILLNHPQRTQQRLGKRPALFWRANLKDSLEIPELMIDRGTPVAIDKLMDLRARYHRG